MPSIHNDTAPLSFHSVTSLLTSLYSEVEVVAQLHTESVGRQTAPGCLMAEIEPSGVHGRVLKSIRVFI